MEFKSKTPWFDHFDKSPLVGYSLLISFFSSMKIFFNDGGCLIFSLTEKKHNPFA